jgi:3',5'-cyclic AMP phosphodiesterase CpdA
MVCYSDKTPFRTDERQIGLAYGAHFGLAWCMADPITLFHISDLHFGAEDHAALAWFAAEVTVQRPDWIICTGDLTMRGTQREFAAAAAWLGALAVPVSVEPGNHDMPYYWEMFSRLRRPFARFEVLRAAVHRAVDLPDVRLVSLPTVVPAQARLNWSKGRVTQAALATAVDGLAGFAGLRLVACHHPLVDADTQGKGSTRGGKAALKALAVGGADAVLSGHVHDPFDLLHDTGGGPIRLIGAGTLSERLRVTKPSFNVLTWTAKDSLRVDVRGMG